MPLLGEATVAGLVADDQGLLSLLLVANLGLGVTPENDFAQWYQDIIKKAELAENGDYAGAVRRVRVQLQAGY